MDYQGHSHSCCNYVNILIDLAEKVCKFRENPWPHMYKQNSLIVKVSYMKYLDKSVYTSKYGG